MQRVLSVVKWPWVLALGGLLAVLIAVPPISRDQSHFGRMVLAAVALGLVQLGFWFDKKQVGERARRALTAAWAAAALYGAFNYYQFDATELTTVGDYADATYYYLNSKYFPELGYARIYEAMLVADEEGPRRFKRVPRYRDLTTYRDLHARRHALDKAEEIKAHFTPERWESFKHDLSYISKRSIKGGFNYFFIDHGYNPPPPWTFVGGLCAQFVAVENLKWITSIDIVLVAGLMLGVARLCGLRALLVTLVFFLCTFSGRWPMLGQSMLRFDWLVALVAGVLCLRAGRYGWAGAGFAYAACNRIFPAIFLLPVGVGMLAQWVSERRIPREHWRFAGGALIMASIVLGGAYVRYGAEGYRESRERLALHGSPESFSSHRVGLGHVLMYRGEWTRKEIDANGGIEGKRAELWGLDPYLKAGGLVLIALVALYVWRSREPLHRNVWLAIYPLFCMTTPQINYYNLRLLLVLFHTERWEIPRDRLGLSLLFATEAASQAVHVMGGERYAVTYVTSIGLLLYLITMGVFLVLGLRRRQGIAPELLEPQRAE